MASLENSVQTQETTGLVPLATAACCCPGCCDDAECAGSETPCC